MVTHFILVDTKHQSIKDGRRKVVRVNLAALVWRCKNELGVLLVLICEEEHVAI